ncbi:RDD family protein [Actinoplanes sp. NPDC051851]|uniref:RDD family protein n=1 Tax=Actinoplanes sp. NPDC051851 TaxID=3154753 RepID=UPI00341B8C47
MTDPTAGAPGEPVPAPITPPPAPVADDVTEPHRPVPDDVTEARPATAEVTPVPSADPTEVQPPVSPWQPPPGYEPTQPQAPVYDPTQAYPQPPTYDPTQAYPQPPVYDPTQAYPQPPVPGYPGQPAPGYPVPGQPVSGQPGQAYPAPGQAYPAPGYAPAPGYPAQPYPGQPYPPVSGVPAPGQPAAYPVPPVSGMPASGAPQGYPPPQYGAVAPYQPYPQAPYGKAPGFVPGNLRLASPGARLGATVLDFVLALITLGLGWIIWSLFTWSNGQTPAKQLLGQVVVNETTGEVFGWGRMALREFVIKGFVSAIASNLSFGIFWFVDSLMIFGEGNKTLHDRMVESIVVYR